MQRESTQLNEEELECCDLSGRTLSTSQIERTLGAFSTSHIVNLSKNELDRLPMTLPKHIIALDISFNFITNIQGMENLGELQDLKAEYNRLASVSQLQYCQQLVRVNLSGNRLINTEGLETLTQLMSLDLSNNLLEKSDALRPLAINQNLTDLSLKGNPISNKLNYRVLVLGMLPSVLLLDNCKIRTTIRNRVKRTDGSSNSHTVAKSLSYSRLYNDKKEYDLQNRTTWNSINVNVQRGNWASPRYSKDTTNISSFSDPSTETNWVSSHSPKPYVSIYDRLVHMHAQNQHHDDTARSAHHRAPSDLIRPRNVTNTSSSTTFSSDFYKTTRNTPNSLKGNRNRSQKHFHSPSRPTKVPYVRQQIEACVQDKYLCGQLQFPLTQGEIQTTRKLPVQLDGLNSVSQEKSSFTRNSYTQKDIQQSDLPQKAEISTVADQNINAVQKNVLSVIQNLIDHKKQSIAALSARKYSKNPTVDRIQPPYIYLNAKTTESGELSISS